MLAGKYGLVLIDLALLRDDEESKRVDDDNSDNEDENSDSIDKRVEHFMRAIAPVLLPKRSTRSERWKSTRRLLGLHQAKRRKSIFSRSGSFRDEGRGPSWAATPERRLLSTELVVKLGRAATESGPNTLKIRDAGVESIRFTDNSSFFDRDKKPVRFAIGLPKHMHVTCCALTQRLLRYDCIRV